MAGYVYKLNFVIDNVSEDSNEILDIENYLDDIANKVQLQTSNKLEYISMQIVKFSLNNNYGRCVNCSEWVSDMSKPDCIQEFSHGIELLNEWYCDICLPESHKDHF